MPTSKRERQRAGRQARRVAAQAAMRKRQQRRRVAAFVGLVAVITTIGLGISLTSNDEGTDVASDSTTTTAPAEPGSTPCPAADGSSEQMKKFDGPPRQCLEEGREYTAVFETDVGTFKVELDHERAPATVNNFVFLARYHAYDDVPFHRVIPDFAIQGGDVEMGNGQGGPGYQFPDELPEPGDYEEGSVAMANSGPNTNGSQFFIVASDKGAETLVQASRGAANYSLFGKVVDGMDVVKKIEADGAEDPNPPKVIHKMVKVTIEEKEA